MLPIHKRGFDAASKDVFQRLGQLDPRLEHRVAVERGKAVDGEKDGNRMIFLRMQCAARDMLCFIILGIDKMSEKW